MPSQVLTSAGGLMGGGRFSLNLAFGQSTTGTSAAAGLVQGVGFWRLPPGTTVDARPQFDGRERISRLQLYPNSPNPFTRSTSIQYAIPLSSGETRVRVAIYTVSGRLLRVIDDRVRLPGVHTCRWDGRDRFGSPMSSGVYFCRLDAGRSQITRRLILVQ